jgi:hypothetical protein
MKSIAPSEANFAAVDNLVKAHQHSPVRAFALFLLLALLLRNSPAAVPVIFDTDMDSDCDDAAALAILHAIADRGEATILGTLVSSKHPWSAPCVDAINTFFKRPDLPIGVPKGPGGNRARFQIRQTH